MADLAKMKYRVYQSRNPITGNMFLRPVITKRNTMGMKQLVEFAQTAGFVRGHQKDLEGLLGGFIEAMRNRAKAGYTINVDNWFTITGQLRGIVGEDRRLTSANDYHVTIAAAKDLKVDIANFSWSRVDDAVPFARVERLCSTNGNPGEITRMQGFIVIGRNLSFNAAWGDRLTMSWTEGEDTKTVELTPITQGSDFLSFDWPEVLENVPVGTLLTFTFRLHGAEDAAEQTCTKTAKLVAAS
ncbi:MAG: hypothetical protein ACI4RA_05705 [Kiritimatiellia bacterium]